MVLITGSELAIAVIGRGKVGKSLLVERIISGKISINKVTENSIEEPLNLDVRLIPSGPNVNLRIASIEILTKNPKNNTHNCVKAISDSDFVLLVLDAREELDDNETYLIAQIRERKLPFLIAVNKIEFGTNPNLLTELDALDVVYFEISCQENAGLDSMKKKLIRMLPVKPRAH